MSNTIFDGKYEYHIDAHVTHDIRATHLRRRLTQPRHIVVHWTGAENPPERVAKTLDARGLSVDFVISADGAIYQLNDDLENLRTMHAGHRVNHSSIGIEVVCKGVPSVFRPFTRRAYYGKCQGKRREMLDFWPAQYDALWELIKLLTDVYKIPRYVPLDGKNLVVRDVIQGYLPPGILAHYMVSPRKIDPGPAPMIWLREKCSELSSSRCYPLH